MKTQAIIDAAQGALDDIRNPEYPNFNTPETRDVVRARVALSALIAALKSEEPAEIHDTPVETPRVVRDRKTLVAAGTTEDGVTWALSRYEGTFWLSTRASTSGSGHD